MNTETLSADAIVQEAEVTITRAMSPGRTLADLALPKHGDEAELLKDRFLCRGGGALFIGPTGLGKSSWIAQAAICWTLGKPFYGITPARPLRVALLQAENDDGDMVEMRDGITRGMTGAGLATVAEVTEACERIRVVTEDAITGERFGPWLDSFLTAEEHKPDLVMVDPVFAFFGADASNQEKVSGWLRNVLNPVIHRHGVGLLLVHHSNKPAGTKEQRGAWQAGDFAYLGAGSAEWCNWARSVLALRSLGNHTVFELRAAKRGRRLGWRDVHGEDTYFRHVAHGNGGGIYWREPTLEEIAELEADATEGRGRPKEAQPADLVAPAVELLKTRSLPVAEFRELIMDRFSIGSNKAFRVIALAVDAGTLEKCRAGRAELIGQPDRVKKDAAVWLEEHSRKLISVNP